jgi:hypothetical protein
MGKRVIVLGASLEVPALALTPTRHAHVPPSRLRDRRPKCDELGWFGLSGQRAFAEARFETYPGWVFGRDKTRSERDRGFRFGSLPGSRVHRSISGPARKVRKVSTVARQISKSLPLVPKPCLSPNRGSRNDIRNSPPFQAGTAGRTRAAVIRVCMMDACASVVPCSWLPAYCSAPANRVPQPGGMISMAK